MIYQISTLDLNSTSAQFIKLYLVIETKLLLLAYVLNAILDVHTLVHVIYREHFPGVKYLRQINDDILWTVSFIDQGESRVGLCRI